MAKTETIIVRVTSAEKREIRLVGRAEGVSASEAIRRAMRERASKLAGA